MQTLRFGSVGPDVAAWQSVLGLRADGVFGPATRTATIAYQIAHHLTADGVVGTDTWRAAGLAPALSVIEGIDLSAAQAGAHIDFARAYQAGIRFVVVRTQAGEAAQDSTLVPFLTDARAAGHLVSVYQYALPDEDPADDVAALLQAIDGIELDFPAWLDLETMNGRSPAQVIEWSAGWEEGYRAARGHHPTIYSGRGFWSGLGALGDGREAQEAFAGCELASAAYGAAVPPVFGPFKRAAFHQYAGNLIARMLKSWAWMGKVYRAGEHVWGSVARAAIAAGTAERIASPGIVEGIEGEVDRDHFYGTLDELRALTNPVIVT